MRGGVPQIPWSEWPEEVSADLLVEFNEAEAAEAAPTFELGGRAIRYIGKAALIRNKKAAGRRMDLADVESRRISGLAESKGFEPLVGCPTPDFESGTFGHSVSSPPAKLLYR